MAGGKSGTTKKPKTPKWVIDTHGLKAVLESKSNSIRAAVLSAIESGEMWLLKPVSKEFKELYDHLYEQLQSFSYKKYMEISTAARAKAAVVMESYGSPLLGSIPSVSHFEAVSA